MTGKVEETRLCKSGASANLTMELEATYVRTYYYTEILRKHPNPVGHQGEGNHHNRNVGTYTVIRMCSGLF